jgi:hypothetical protein
MDKFIARANIDHYLETLNNHDVSTRNRSLITKLLIEEEDKLGHDREQLEFAEDKALACRNRADRQRRLVDSFDPGSADWVQAERLLVNFESLAQFAERFCQQMRKRVSENRI